MSLLTVLVMSVWDILCQYSTDKVSIDLFFYLFFSKQYSVNLCGGFWFCQHSSDVVYADMQK